MNDLMRNRAIQQGNNVEITIAKTNMSRKVFNNKKIVHINKDIDFKPEQELTIEYIEKRLREEEAILDVVSFSGNLKENFEKQVKTEAELERVIMLFNRYNRAFNINYILNLSKKAKGI